MDLNALIAEFCEPGGSSSFEQRCVGHDCTMGLSPSGAFPGLQSSSSLPTLLDTRTATVSTLGDTFACCPDDASNFECEGAGQVSKTGSTACVTQVPSTQAFEMADALHQLRQDYAQLEDNCSMMEKAAQAEITELRMRLHEAHCELAEAGTTTAVSECAEKIVAHHALQEELRMSNEHLLMARAELSCDFAKKISTAHRFGPPEHLIVRIINSRWERVQLKCFSVWRMLVLLRPAPQSLHELEVEMRCWDKAHRLQVVAFAARRMFSAWRRLSEQQERFRLRRLVDMAHDSWGRLHASIHQAVNQHVATRASAAASRCFAGWLGCYHRSIRLARLWRRFGKERHRQLLQWCFMFFLRSVLVRRKDRIESREVVSAERLHSAAKTTVNLVPDQSLLEEYMPPYARQNSAPEAYGNYGSRRLLQPRVPRVLHYGAGA